MRLADVSCAGSNIDKPTYIIVSILDQKGHSFTIKCLDLRSVEHALLASRNIFQKVTIAESLSRVGMYDSNGAWIVLRDLAEDGLAW